MPKLMRTLTGCRVSESLEETKSKIEQSASFSLQQGALLGAAMSLDDVDGIMGADGKELDVYINPDACTDKIFRITQLNVKTQEFDEYKIMLNFESIGDALTGYLNNYPKDWKGLGGIEE